MRLAIVEPSSQGGLLHYAVQLADGLAGRGHAVDLLVPVDNELRGHVRGPARMRAVLAPQNPPPGGALAEVRTIRRARVASRLLRSWGRVNWELRRQRYDAVILNSDIDLWPMAAIVLPITFAKRGMRVAGVCHSVRPLNRWSGDELYVDSPLLNGLLRILYPRLDAIFVHGERSKSEFQAAWPPARLALIPHGDERIFAGEPPPPAPEERALFFGEWRKVKGLGVLMEAFEQLLVRRPSARLTIAGSPCPVDLDPEVVRRWAARYPDSVEVIDSYIPVEDVPRLFGQARAVVTPYLTGYQSGVVHLAMTMARAVVSTEVGDLATAVLDGETGLTVPPGDADALALALERVLSDADLAVRLGETGRCRLLEGSSWEVVAELVERALSEQVALSPGPTGASSR
jgi:glycosyltransferase involved in cell wall biosynthesis